MSEDKPWNICDDFFGPLAELLAQGVAGWDVVGDDLIGVVPQYSNVAHYSRRLRAQITNGHFALAWIDAHYSTGLSDRIRQVIEEAIQNLQTEGTNEALLYVRDLAVIMGSNGHIPKGKVPESSGRGDWVGPYTMHELEKMLHKAESTIRRKMKAGELTVKKGPLGWMIHQAHLPNK